jgi:hypothetical protein
MASVGQFGRPAVPVGEACRRLCRLEMETQVCQGRNDQSENEHWQSASQVRRVLVTLKEGLISVIGVGGLERPSIHSWIVNLKFKGDVEKMITILRFPGKVPRIQNDTADHYGLPLIR